MAWRVEASRTAERQIKKLNQQTQGELIRYLRERVQEAPNPRHFGKAPRGEKEGLWRCRAGDYRIIRDIRDPEKTSVLLALGHRKQIYR